MKQRGFLNTSKSRSRNAPLVYRALLNQTGGAPVATVLENTLGADITWIDTDVGKFTASGYAFPSNAYANISLPLNLEEFASTDVLPFVSYLFGGGELKVYSANIDVAGGTVTLVDGVLVNALLEVYVP
jgi:hypothetical protein